MVASIYAGINLAVPEHANDRLAARYAGEPARAAPRRAATPLTIARSREKRSASCCHSGRLSLHKKARVGSPIRAVERKTGFEPATFCMASKCSTN